MWKRREREREREREKMKMNDNKRYEETRLLKSSPKNPLISTRMKKKRREKNSYSSKKKDPIFYSETNSNVALIYSSIQEGYKSFERILFKKISESSTFGYSFFDKLFLL